MFGDVEVSEERSEVLGMSAKATLELTDGEEVPEWCPPDIWPLLKRKMILLRAGVLKDSVAKVAAGLGLEVGKVSGLLRVKKWAKQVTEFREQMAQKGMIAAEAMVESLIDDLDDAAKVAKMSPRDKSIVTKQMSEMVLNLANGVVGSPAIGVNFNDIKILLSQTVEKPVVLAK